MKKRLFSLVLAVLMLCSLVPAAQAAAEPAASVNNGRQTYHPGYMIYIPERNVYSMSRWASPVRSYLFARGEDFCRVEYIAGETPRLVAETYDHQNTLLTQRELPLELPIFGGFFAGADGCFAVFGQENRSESDSAEIIRVVRYSKDFERLGSASLYGENTVVPFDAGSLRMTEDGTYLYIHTCHKMYAIEGVNHQANLTFAVRKSSMTVTDVRSSIMNYSVGYVSHSFNQFIALDGNQVVTLDHGDARPRSLWLYRCQTPDESGRFLPAFYNGRRGAGVNLMTFAGENGDNATGASVGGFAVTASHYLAVGSSIDQSGAGGSQRNVFVSTVPKGDFTDGAVQTRWLTSYPDAEPQNIVRVSTPQLASLGDGRLLVLWTVEETLFYQFLHADGTPTGKTFSAPGALSDCAPTVTDGRVQWYVTFGAGPEFYAIDSAGALTVSHETELRGAKEASCETDGYTGDRVCTLCGRTLETGSAIPATGHKTELRGAKEAACETDGYTGDRVCTVCGKIVAAGATIPALGHKTELRSARQPDCTHVGYSGNLVCTVCGKTVKMGMPLAALGHQWDDGKITKQPTETAEGERTFTCAVCGVTKTESIAKLAPAKPDPVKPDPAKPDPVEPDPAKPDPVEPDPVKPDPVKPDDPTPSPAAKVAFKDVDKRAYYAPAVAWAVERGVTNGTSETTFSPNDACTRGQVVTFLWRAMGEPEPGSTKNPFQDVKSGAYYYKAVLWAVEQGVTNGTSKTTFSPEQPCTRAHVVTFLWRTHEKPPAGKTNPFKDVPAGAYYTEPVLWAVKNEITNGTSTTTFSPNNTCTRGQIVTFLYRDLG